MRRVKFKFYRQIGKTGLGEPIYKNLETGKITIGESSTRNRKETHLHQKTREL